MIEKILVIGSGFLGKNILEEISNLNKIGVGTQYTSKNNQILLDIRDENAIDYTVSQFMPDLIINCAANVYLDDLEKKPELAFSINAEGAKNVAIIAKRKKIKLVHISSDGVFDGKKGMYSEEDLPNPINVYGKSKLLGEKLIQENSDNYVIVRTNFFGIHKNGKDLLNWIVKSLRERKTIIGFDDIIFSPLEISNLSKMILDISMTDYNGILHLASNEPISKYNFALSVANVFGLDSKLIKKGTSDDVKLVAKRPKNTSLSNNKSKKFLETEILPLIDSLKKLKIAEEKI